MGHLQLLLPLVQVPRRGRIMAAMGMQTRMDVVTVRTRRKSTMMGTMGAEDTEIGGTTTEIGEIGETVAKEAVVASMATGREAAAMVTVVVVVDMTNATEVEIVNLTTETANEATTIKMIVAIIIIKTMVAVALSSRSSTRSR